MDLKLTVKCGDNPFFSKHKLEAIASSIKVTIPDRMRLVYYGQKPPMDTTLTWQPTNGAGDPVGKVKVFKKGDWNE